MNRNAQYCEFCNEELVDSDESWQVCCDSSEIFYKSLMFGRFRGVADIRGCVGKEETGVPPFEQLIRELVSRDILVTMSGCAAREFARREFPESESSRWAGEGLAEFCDHLGIQPVLYGGGDGDDSRILDLFNRMARHAGTDRENLPMADVMAGKKGRGIPFNSEADPMATADLIDEQIHGKRMGLEWNDRYHCSMATYS